MSNANEVKVKYVKETEWGKTPESPTFDTARFTSIEVNPRKDTAESTEIDPNRMTKGLIVTGRGLEGSMGFELSFGTHDAFLAAALQGTFVELSTKNISTTTDGIVFTDDTEFGKASGAKLIKISGSSTEADNGVWIVDTVDTANKTIKVRNHTFAAVSTGLEADIKYIRNGKVKDSFSIVEDFSDISKYQIASGVMINTASISCSSQSIVTGTFNFIGRDGQFSTDDVEGTVNPATNTPALSASDNVSDLILSGLADNSAVGVTAIEFEINNNIAEKPVVGSPYSYGLTTGKLQITGTLTTYFDNLSMAQAFVKHDTVGMQIPFEDELGNALMFTFPAMKIASASPNVTGENTQVELASDFTVISDGEKMIQIDMIAAS